MPMHLLDTVPLALLALVTLVVVLGALEAGFRFGSWRRSRSITEHDTTLGGAVAATLGLVAFLLAFTFGLAASRFEDRRMVLLDEVNALDAAFLRADLIEEPQRSATQGLLREYVDVRLSDALSGNLTSDLRRPEELQAELWKQVVALTAAHASTPTQALFVKSINLVIETHATRLDMARHRIPSTIWLALYVIIIVAMAKVGYQSGVSGPKRSAALPVLALTFCVVLALIADLDRPLQGLLTVSQQSMIDLKQKMATSP